MGGLISFHRHILKIDKCHKYQFLFYSESYPKENLTLLKLPTHDQNSTTFTSVYQNAKYTTNAVWNYSNQELAGPSLNSRKPYTGPVWHFILELHIWCPILSRPIIIDLINIFSDALKKSEPFSLYPFMRPQSTIDCR